MATWVVVGSRSGVWAAPLRRDCLGYREGVGLLIHAAETKVRVESRQQCGHHSTDGFTANRGIVPMSFMSWNEVVAIHNAHSGISTKDGMVRSILCNQAKDGCADEVRGDRIFYRVASNTNPRGVAILRGMVGLNWTVRVFEEVGANQWQDHGQWFVHDWIPESECEVFLLTRNRL